MAAFRHYICKYFEKFTWRGHRIMSFTAVIPAPDDVEKDTYMMGHTDDYLSLMFKLDESMTPSGFVRINGIEYERL
jgi:hypothetical protein